MGGIINALIAQGAPKPTWNYQDSMANALAIRKAQREELAYPEERAWIGEQRQMKREEFGLQKEQATREKYAFDRKKMMEPWEDMATTLGGLEAASPYLSPENYDDFISFATTQKGVSRFLKLPTLAELENKAMGEGVKDTNGFRRWFENFKSQSLIGLKSRLAMMKAQKDATLVAPADSTVIAPGQPPIQVPGKKQEVKPQSDIGKLQADREWLLGRGYTEDSPVIKSIDDEMKKKSKTEEKEVNMPAWYDAMGAKKLGKKYQTKAGRDAFADWVADPGNEKEVNSFQSQYTEQNTPKTVNILQTGTGFQPYVSKGPGVGTVGKTIEGAGKPLPNDVTTQLANMKNTVDRISDLELRSKDLKGRFGPIEGRWTALRQKLVNDGPTQELMNEMSGLITMAYALSGKQISYQEMEMLKQAILPTLNQPYQNFLATVNMSRQWLISQHNDMLDYFHGTGHSSNLKKLEAPKAGSGGARPPLGAFEGK